ncbi:unnamed protein product, partial [marine sediment metagenome]
MSSREDSMSIFLKSKLFYATGNRHDGECYSAVIDERCGSKALTYLRVSNKRESLIYRASKQSEETLLASNTYVLSTTFSGEYLFWVERCNNHWQIKAVSADSPDPGDIFEAYKHWGRPNSLSSSQPDNISYLVWEERKGKRTRIYISKIAKR